MENVAGWVDLWNDDGGCADGSEAPWEGLAIGILFAQSYSLPGELPFYHRGCDEYEEALVHRVPGGTGWCHFSLLLLQTSQDEHHPAAQLHTYNRHNVDWHGDPTNHLCSAAQCILIDKAAFIPKGKPLD